MVASSLEAGSPEIVQAFDRIYLIHLSVDEWGWKVAGTAFNSKFIPIFYRLNEQGAPTGDWADGGVWGEDTPQNIARGMGPWLHAP